jgi:hypothetical protein
MTVGEPYGRSFEPTRTVEKHCMYPAEARGQTFLWVVGRPAIALADARPESDMGTARLTARTIRVVLLIVGLLHWT